MQHNRNPSPLHLSNKPCARCFALVVCFPTPLIYTHSIFQMSSQPLIQNNFSFFRSRQSRYRMCMQRTFRLCAVEKSKHRFVSRLLCICGSLLCCILYTCCVVAFRIVKYTLHMARIDDGRMARSPPFARMNEIPCER